MQRMSSYAVIFTSKRTDSDPNGYEDMATSTVSTAKTQKGFSDVESARGPDGIGITVSYWNSLESIKSWKENESHRQAQSLGRSKWYESYVVRICKVEREYGLGNR